VMVKIQKFILGPCSVENRDLFFQVAEALYPKMQGREWYLKGSFDKANRTSMASDRGPGMEESIDIFDEVRRHFPGIMLTTDVHETWQINRLIGQVDMIQIPAFLCRQTDLVADAACNFKRINIKKGQWMAAEQMRHVVEKAKAANPKCEVWVTERGSQFGTDRLIVDFRGVEVMREFSDAVILDCTHSTQMSGNGVTGGDRQLAKRYARAAGIFGYDGVFIETHPDPEQAISDRDSQVELNWLESWIDTL
jgi:2-dehydro-3-deoxyphosphooctonate aldolase (KDO 8-P synthase)